MKEDSKYYKVDLPNSNGYGLKAVPTSGLRAGSIVTPDATNATAMSTICNTMDEEKCDWWKICCDAAEKCCHRHWNMGSSSPKPGYCPRTWDGFGCFDDTLAGIRAHLDCPEYVEHALPYGKLNITFVCLR